MINLIPPQAKKNLLLEYWVRVSATWLSLWAFALLCSACVLFPAYVLISSQVEVYQASAAEASQKVADYQLTTQALIQASQQARAITDESRLDTVSKYILLFEELQGAGIQLSEIKIARAIEEVDGLAPVVLVGIASDRQTLASFRDSLLAAPMVESVDLPISNLARDRDIQFTLSVVISNESES